MPPRRSKGTPTTRRAPKGMPAQVVAKPPPKSPPPLKRDQTVAVAANEMAADAVARLDSCWQDLLDANTPERVHRFRVALRQLRVVLHIFRKLEPSGRIRDLRHGLAAIALGAGRQRELDVMIDEIVRPLQDASEVGDVGALVARLEAERDDARDATKREITSLGAQSLRRQLAELPDHLRAWAEESHPKALIAKFAHRDLKRRWRHLVEHAGDFDSLDIAGLHEMRKTLKKLRYAFIYFAPFYDKRTGVKFLARLRQMQTALGYVHDVESTRQLLGRFEATTDRVDLSFTIGLVLGTHIERASHVRRRAKKHWQQIAAADIAEVLAQD